MTDNAYEGLFILDTNRYGRDPAGVSARVSQLIEKQGGTVLVSRLWEERRLAYPINGQRKGTYWLTYFRMDGENLPKFNEQANRDDGFLRHMVLKVDPRIVDALVSHAQNVSTGEVPAAEGKTTDGGATESAVSSEATAASVDGSSNGAEGGAKEVEPAAAE